MTDKYYPLSDYQAALEDRKLSARFNRGRTDSGISWASERLYALKILAGNEKLRKGTPKSLQLAMMSLAKMGLSLDPNLSHAYLTIRKTSILATPSYMGFRYLAMITPEIANIQADLVYEKDQYKRGMDRNGPYIEHEVARSNRGKVTHAYCVTFFNNGTRQVEEMTIEELEKCKDAAANAQHGVPFTWKKWEGEMQKKSVTRRARKHWPITASRMASAIDAMDKAEPMQFSEESKALSPRQASTLLKMIKGSDEERAAAVENLCGIFGVSSIEDIPSGDYEVAKKVITERSTA